MHWVWAKVKSVQSTLRPDGYYCRPFKVATPIMGLNSNTPIRCEDRRSSITVFKSSNVVSLFGMRVNSDFPNNSRIYKFENHFIPSLIIYNDLSLFLLYIHILNITMYILLFHFSIYTKCIFGFIIFLMKISSLEM